MLRKDFTVDIKKRLFYILINDIYGRYAMLSTRQIQDEIIRIKKEKDICILAHAYMDHEILEVADYTGDSYGLSCQAAKAPQKTVLMCGVRFMAETVKILSPDKKVILSNPQAGCPMAQQLGVDELKALKEKYPDHTVVAYINTTAALKTVCDVCVTSASAVKIVKNIKNDKILFIPDCNLGAFVASQVPEKQFVFFNGGCPVHSSVSFEEAKKTKELYPNARLLVHPECIKEIAQIADYVGSTTGIMDHVRKSSDREFIIGTENSILSHLQYECPDRIYHPLSPACICKDMKLTTLMDVYNCVNGSFGEEIILDEETVSKALGCINTMLELG